MGNMVETNGLKWTLEEAKATKTDGVFSVDLTWYFHVSVATSLYEMLPDVVAARYIAAGIVPIEGYVYPAYPFASVRSVSCDRISGGMYKYTAQYSDKNSSEKKATDENPLNDLPIIKPSAGMITRAITRDIHDHAILNAAGDPIIQTMDDNTIGLTVTSNIASVPAAFMLMRNSRNSGAFTIGRVPVPAKAARYILPSNWLSEPKARNDISYLEFTYELQFDEVDFHDGKPLNAGFRKLEGTTPDITTVTIVNADGSEPSEPVCLDDDGHVIENVTPETAVYRTVEKYWLADFSVLPGVNL